MPRRERRVATKRGGPVGASPDHPVQLAPACDPEVERGADPLRGERKGVACRVTYEEDLARGGLPETVRVPVPLVADAGEIEPLSQFHGRPLDAVVWIERSHSDSQLV